MRNSISKTIVAGLAALSISAATVSLPATPASAAWGGGNWHGGGGMGGWHGGGGWGGGWHGGGWNGGWHGGGWNGGWRGGGWAGVAAAGLARSRVEWRLGLGWLRLGLGRLRRLVGPGIGHWRGSRRCRLLPLLGRLLWLPVLWVRRLRRLSEASPDLQSQRTLPWPTLGERLLEGRCAARSPWLSAMATATCRLNQFSARSGRSHLELQSGAAI